MPDTKPSDCGTKKTDTTQSQQVPVEETESKPEAKKKFEHTPFQVKTEQDSSVKPDSDDNISESSESESSDSDSESEMSTPKINLLTNENYDSWSIKIEAVLNQKSRWIELDTALETPELIATAKAAYYDIIIYVDDQHSKFLRSVAKDNSVKALIALKEKYEGKGAMSKIQLLVKCLKSKHSNGRVGNHIDELRQDFQKLSSKGLVIDEIIQVATLMTSVADDFNPILSGFMHLKEDQLNFEDVAYALIAEETRRSLTGEKGIASSATQPFSKREKRRFLKCTKCNKMGHDFKECEGRNYKNSKFQPTQQKNVS